MTRLLYSEYQSIFGDFAKIPEPGFSLWISRSIAEINRYTTKNVEEIQGVEAQRCIFEVAGHLYDKYARCGIKSENTDGYSVTYTGGDEGVYTVIRKYLKSYLYRGVEL